MTTQYGIKKYKPSGLTVFLVLLSRFLVIGGILAISESAVAAIVIIVVGILLRVLGSKKNGKDLSAYFTKNSISQRVQNDTPDLAFTYYIYELNKKNGWIDGKAYGELIVKLNPAAAVFVNAGKKK